MLETKRIWRTKIKRGEGTEAGQGIKVIENESNQRIRVSLVYLN